MGVASVGRAQHVATAQGGRDIPYQPTYPPGFPSISGENLTVSAFLANPARVYRVIQDLTLQRYVAERIFQAGPRATGGSVVYDQVTQADLFTDRDVEVIAPGAEFPLLTAAAPVPKTAAVDKWGGRVKISDESRDRNQIDVLNRELTRLRNTIVRKVDTVAIAALDAAALNTYVGVDFTAATSAQIIAVWIAASGLVNNPDMGYETSAVFLNPTQADEMMGNEGLLKLLQAAPSSTARRASSRRSCRARAAWSRT
ncbi:MAG: hypothetical protein LC798_21495 [Chloroflexi bacterium]|nr:hypothetical protein [Chloroflexota bacterium]